MRRNEEGRKEDERVSEGCKKKRTEKKKKRKKDHLFVKVRFFLYNKQLVLSTPDGQYCHHSVCAFLSPVGDLRSMYRSSNENRFRLPSTKHTSTQVSSKPICPVLRSESHMNIYANWTYPTASPSP